mmetsp:Transcript_31035/g.42032  ORF Transcript_31035/g.42032 Transcript_31035/m.42032 type:complete len:207 (-) Transcript_31035:2114-2734(-)
MPVNAPATSTSLVLTLTPNAPLTSGASPRATPKSTNPRKLRCRMMPLRQCATALFWERSIALAARRCSVCGSTLSGKAGTAPHSRQDGPAFLSRTGLLSRWEKTTTMNLSSSVRTSRRRCCPAFTRSGRRSRTSTWISRFSFGDLIRSLTTWTKTSVWCYSPYALSSWCCVCTPTHTSSPLVASSRLSSATPWVSSSGMPSSSSPT